MIDDMKYVMDEYGNFAIFSPIIQHVDAAKLFNIHPLMSAGFVRVTSSNDQVQVECWGESISLGGLKSRGVDDATIIQAKL